VCSRLAQQVALGFLKLNDNWNAVTNKLTFYKALFAQKEWLLLQKLPNSKISY
jgi:hypothetical protein